MKQRYVAEAIPALKSEFGYRNVMQVPRLEKIVVNTVFPDTQFRVPALKGR